MTNQKYIKNKKEKCIIYCRVSTDKQAKEGESLDVQEEICRGVADRQNLEVVEVFKESFSGRKDHRPVYDEMLEFIKHNSGINKLIIRTLDRFTRGGSYSYEQLKKELEELGISIIDSMGIIQPVQNTLADLDFEYSWSKYSPSQMSETVMAESHSEEVRNTLTRLVGQSIRVTQKGYKIRQANDGYLSQKIFVDGKKRYIQVPDPDRKDYFIEMFNMRATGQYTDKEIVEQINAQGYLTRTKNKWDDKKEHIIGTIGGIKLKVKRLQELIANPVYCGVICEKWTHNKPIRAAYDGLISIDLFNKANRGKIFIKEKDDGELEMLYDYSPARVVQRRNKNNPLYPFKNIILCPECRKAFLGSAPRGKSGKKHPTYHCSRGHKYFGITKDEFENSVKKYVESFKFTDRYFGDCKFFILKKYKEKLKKINTFADSVGNNIKNLEIKKQTTIQAYVTAKSDVVKQNLEKEIEKLEKEIESMSEYEEKIKVNENDINRFIRYVKKLMEHKEKWLVDTSESVNLQRQQTFFSLVFRGFPTYEEIINGTPKLSFILELKQQKRHIDNDESSLVAPRGIEPLFPG